MIKSNLRTEANCSVSPTLSNEPYDICGLTKREYFAAMALQGLCAGKPAFGRHNVESAVKLADALIEQLNEINRGVT